MQAKRSSGGGRNNGLDIGGRLHKARIRLQETNWVWRGGKKAGLGKQQMSLVCETGNLSLWHDSRQIDT